MTRIMRIKEDKSEEFG